MLWLSRPSSASTSAAICDDANPTTFYVDNVTLNVRHLIPKYWGDSYKNAYKRFIAALGTRYKSTPAGADPKYDLQFVAMGTGTYGESQPTQDQPTNYDHDMKAAGLTTSKQWSDWVNEISAAYASAFSTETVSSVYSLQYLLCVARCFVFFHITGCKFF